MAVKYYKYVYPEWTPVEDNCMCSGDDDFDKKVENDIKRNLDNGNIWAWCLVKVEACAGGVTGEDYLGCVSCKDEQDFIDGGYFEDMKQVALVDLKNKVSAASKILKGCND